MDTCDDKNLLAGKYKIIEEIGKGGMGRVYKILDVDEGVYYAAKVSYINEVTDMLKEGEIIKKLRHMGIPRVKEVFTRGNVIYIIMELVYGRNLEEYISQKKYLSQNEILSIFRQLCNILNYLHNQKPPIIYRDLKPSNIMIEENGKIKLIDFGCARGYQRGKSNDTTVLGTPGYAPPELIGAAYQSDARSDIFSLGATMYFVATKIDIGKPPFETPSINSVRRGICLNLQQIIERCMQKNPKSRYENVNQIISEINLINIDNKMKRKYINANVVNIIITHGTGCI